MIKFEDFIKELISLNQKELILLMKKETKPSFDSSKCNIVHTLTYQKRLKYSFEHKGVIINSLGQKTYAKFLYEDLTKVLEQGVRLKPKGIELLLSLNGVGLHYIGHNGYLDTNGYLDILSIPNLLLDMKKRYKLK